MPPSVRSRLAAVLRSDPAMLLMVLAASALYVVPLLRTGWIPSDEGTLAQSALRVYQGQLPHRDFAEIYTGGLSFIHAAAFRIFGVNLFSFRIAVFCFFLAWLPAVYFIARRFVAPFWAGVVTFTAVSWSYPNYVGAMPSWYNLFFATFGAAALLRFIETRTRRWLFLAGVCGGASLLIKIVGLYYIAAVLLFLLFVEQGHRETAAGGSSRLYRATCSLLLTMFVALVAWMVWPQLRDGEVYHFVLPSAACAALLIWRNRRLSSGNGSISSVSRAAALCRLVLPFAMGVAAVLAVYLIPYAASGSAASLVRGVGGSAASRMVGLAGKLHAPGIVADLYGVVPLVVILAALYIGWMRHRAVAWIVAAGLAGVVVCAAVPAHLQDTWLMAGTLTPLIVLLGAATILRAEKEGIGTLSQERIMLLISLAAVCSLVQYPFPWVTYFCYIAPLTLLAVVASVSARRNPPGKPVLAVVLGFFLAFGLFGMVRKHMYDPDLDVQSLQPLSLPRSGGLRVQIAHPGYEELIPFLQAHSPNGLLYAGNDCPELYFLSGLKNPTRDDTGAPVEDVLAALHSGKLELVALNDRSFFAGSSESPQLLAEVRRELPNTATIGRFSVYWR